MTEKTIDDVMMEIREYTERISEVQRNLLKFIDEYQNDNTNFQTLMQSLNQQEILNNNHKLREFLHLIAEISCNHHRTMNFFDKIDQIIKEIRNQINKFLSNEELFNIFSINNRILLFLFQENIIKTDANLLLRLLNPENSESSESIRKCFNLPHDPYSERSKNHQITVNTEGMREEIKKYGENNSNLCQIIQKDSIDEFISSKTNVNLTIESTIYETNRFLKDKTPSIIEYSAFYGSFKIFQYALKNNAELNNDIWLYAIHGRNLEIIKELENQNIDPPFRSFEDPAIELIKCHHNEFYEFIVSERFDGEDLNYEERNLACLHLFNNSLDSYNYEMILQRFDVDFYSSKNDIFLQFCKNDYYYIIQSFLQVEEIDINVQTIFKINFLFSNEVSYLLLF